MLPEIATPSQIKSGKIRKHISDGTCWSCWPKGCSCPRTPEDVLASLQSSLQDYENVLSDKEKASIRQDIQEIKAIIAFRQT